MLDMLVIRLPMRDEFVTKQGDMHSVLGDVADYGLTSATRYIRRDPVTKVVTHGELYHPYESLPSSYSNMAIKFFDRCRLCAPYMELKASPAKLLQGHNVYGGESILNGAAEMLSILNDVYPWFFKECLDIANADVRQIDTTFSARLPDERLIQPALRFLSTVSNGHRRNDTKKRHYYNTVYFGGATSRLVQSKIYGKFEEVQKTFDEISKKVDRGCPQSKKQLEIYTPALLSFAKGLLRLEHTVKARKLERMGIPLNLWDLINYQKQNPEILQKLWLDGFEPILKTLEGEVMENADDTEIMKLCREKLQSYTKSGKVSYTKANNAFNFYQLLKINGWEDVKERYSSSQFNRNVKSLCDIGIPKALLQNLNNEHKQVIPMVDLVKIDFSNQFPNGYQPPISAHIRAFDYYLNRKKPNLSLVA